MAHSSICDQAKVLLSTARIGCQFRYYQSLPSTNTTAMEWARNGGPAGGVVLADSQTAGRGRHGRSWHAEAGRSLTFSIILRPSLPPERWSLVTLAASVAVVDTITEISPVTAPRVKWPNDVLIDGLKCCGMLLETSFDGSGKTGGALILGVGLNVNQESFERELPATSLRLAVGRPVDRAPLLALLLGRIEERLDSLTDDGGASVRSAYSSHLAGLGKRISVRTMGASSCVEGALAGITDSGALQLRTTSGVQTFHAGDVTIGDAVGGYSGASTGDSTSASTGKSKG